MSASKAQRLLERAGEEPDRLRRHLIVAAVLAEVLNERPVVVGGTAEEFWTRDEYHETDLDVCVPLDEAARRALRDLGFTREGRHWYSDRARVAVEIPDPRIDGDEGRVVETHVEGGVATIIGVDDLYLDRLRQATVNEGVEDVRFYSALAVAAACHDLLDRKYVRRRIADVVRTERVVGESMRRMDRRLGSIVRRKLGG